MRKVILTLASSVLLLFFYVSTSQGGEKTTVDTRSTVQPTPTWTASQQKAYEVRMKMYHKPFFMKPSGSVYICAFCGYKGDEPGTCPKCGFPLTKAGPGPTAQARKGFAYHCDKCGAQSDQPGDCPRHCGGKMVKN
jgi:rubrerythrin